MFSGLFKRIAVKVASAAISAAMDEAEKAVLENAIFKAESSGMKGQDKMVLAINAVRGSAVETLKDEAESALRTKIEQMIDRLGV